MEQEPQQPSQGEPPANADDGTSPQVAGAKGQNAPGAHATPPGASPAPGAQPAYPLYQPYAPPPPYPPPGYYPPAGAYPPSPPGNYTPGQYPAWGAYPAYGWQPQPPAGPPAPPPQAPKRSMPLGLILLLVGLAVGVIAAGVGGTLALTQGRHGVASRAASLTTPGTPTLIPTAMPPGWFDFKDPLNGTIGHEWPVNSYCYFQNGAYHVNPGTTYGGYYCPATRAGNFSAFDMHVTVEEESGPLNYGFGLAFRHASTGNFYTFVIDGNGTTWVGKWTDDKVENISPNWIVPAFTSGLHVRHTLRVTAAGPIFTFYVDGNDVGGLSDTTYADGEVGLFSGGSQLDAAFTNFEVAGAE